MTFVNVAVGLNPDESMNGRRGRIGHNLLRSDFDLRARISSEK